jgi:hypothetical protein
MKRDNAVWQRAMYLTSKPNFKKDIEVAREANNLPISGFASPRDLENWLESQVYGKLEGNDIEESIDLAVAQIINKPEYALSPGWHHSIKRYMYLNTVRGMQLPKGLESRLMHDELTGRPILHVVVSEDITERDYIDEWKRIEIWRKKLKLESLPKQRAANQHFLKRGKFAYELWVQGAPYSEIAEKIEKRFKDKIYVADDAKTIIANFMKQSGI